MDAVKSSTWVIIPLYNEATVISSVIKDLLSVFPNIVCVDDGSSDDSARVARDAGANVVKHLYNLGQGAAIQTGINYALSRPGSQFFITFDADGQHLVDDAYQMLELLTSRNLDVVIGSRFLDKRTKVSILKRLVLRTAVAFENLTTGMKLTDAHNGLRVFGRKGASLLRISQNRMAHASEITQQISRHRLQYSEFPVHIIYTEYSRAKGQSLWNSINILSELWIK